MAISFAEYKKQQIKSGKKVTVTTRAKGTGKVLSEKKYSGGQLVSSSTSKPTETPKQFSRRVLSPLKPNLVIEKVQPMNALARQRLISQRLQATKVPESTTKKTITKKKVNKFVTAFKESKKERAKKLVDWADAINERGSKTDKKERETFKKIDDKYLQVRYAIDEFIPKGLKTNTKIAAKIFKFGEQFNAGTIATGKRAAQAIEKTVFLSAAMGQNLQSGSKETKSFFKELTTGPAAKKLKQIYKDPRTYRDAALGAAVALVLGGVKSKATSVSKIPKSGAKAPKGFKPGRLLKDAKGNRAIIKSNGKVLKLPQNLNKKLFDQKFISKSRGKLDKIFKNKPSRSRISKGTGKAKAQRAFDMDKRAADWQKRLGASFKRTGKVPKGYRLDISKTGKSTFHRTGKLKIKRSKPIKSARDIIKEPKGKPTKSGLVQKVKVKKVTKTKPKTKVKSRTKSKPKTKTQAKKPIIKTKQPLTKVQVRNIGRSFKIGRLPTIGLVALKSRLAFRPMPQGQSITPANLNDIKNIIDKRITDIKKTDEAIKKIQEAKKDEIIDKINDVIQEEIIISGSGQKELQDTIFKQIQTQKLQSITKKEIKSLLLPKLKLKKKSKKKKGRVQGYNVLIREPARKIIRKGKTRRIPSRVLKVTKRSLSKGRAERLLTRGLDRTVAQTGRVKKSKTLVKKPKKVTKASFRKFRKSKSIKNALTEKRKFAIDTRGEKQGITVKGWIARRTKKRKPSKAKKRKPLKKVKNKKVKNGRKKK